MKTIHAESPKAPHQLMASPEVANARPGYAKFISAEKAKCDIMLSILEFLLSFESIIKRDPSGKRVRICAEISSARQKLKD